MEEKPDVILELVSEECPNTRTVSILLRAMAESERVDLFDSFVGDNLRIIPIREDDGGFTYVYELLGAEIPHVKEVFITLGRGTGSFVDYIALAHESLDTVGYGEDLKPLALFEVTKTTNTESRNSSSSQRLTKVVSVKSYYPDTPCFMIYDVRTAQKPSRTATGLHGDRLFKTLGTEVVGVDDSLALPFATVDELLASRDSIKAPVSGQAIKLHYDDDTFYISIKLTKGTNYTICHDPNIGYLAGVAYVLRKHLNWTKPIIVVDHGVPSGSPVGRGNKLSRLLNLLNVQIQGVELSKGEYNLAYWKYDKTTEKVCTILMATMVRESKSTEIVYENHAGSERSYFTVGDQNLVIAKRVDGLNVNLPDVVFANHETKVLYIVEGEMGRKSNIVNGLKQLENFDLFASHYAGKYYPDYELRYELAVNGGSQKNVDNWAGFEPLMHIDDEGVVRIRELFI